MILKGIPYLQTILTLLLCGTAFTARAQADSAEPADSCYPEIICPDSNRLGGNVAALEPLFQKLEALEKKDTTAVISCGLSHLVSACLGDRLMQGVFCILKGDGCDGTQIYLPQLWDTPGLRRIMLEMQI